MEPRDRIVRNGIGITDEPTDKASNQRAERETKHRFLLLTRSIAGATDMATIHVKAAKTTTDPEEVVFDSEYAGFWKGQPNRVQVLGDGKVHAVNSKHIQVKQALRDGVLVEVKHSAKADEQPKADAPKAEK